MKNRVSAILFMAFVIIQLWAVPILAATGGGAETKTDGKTEVLAGVVVDYMGKLRFEVKDRDSLVPIPGASVEIWIPSLQDGAGAYVLLGVTNESGVLELEVAYDTLDQENKFESTDGKLIWNGSLLYLSNNHLQYRVYKAGWLPYPYDGEVEVELKEIPQVVTILLYQKGGGNGSGGGSGSTSRPDGPGTVIEEHPRFDQPETGPGEPLFPIPKTGVENYAVFWGLGSAALFMAAVITCILIYRDKRNDKTEHPK